MLALAGELADGVLLNYLPASHVAWSVEQVHRGAAERTDGGPTIYAYVHAGVGDPADGVELAQRDLFSYAVVDAYAANFERAGFGDEVAQVRAAHAERDRQGALAAVSPRMIDAIDLMGTAEQVAARIDEYVQAGVDVPILMPLPWGPDRRPSWMPRCGPRPATARQPSDDRTPPHTHEPRRPHADPGQGGGGHRRGQRHRARPGPALRGRGGGGGGGRRLRRGGRPGGGRRAGRGRHDLRWPCGPTCRWRTTWWRSSSAPRTTTGPSTCSARTPASWPSAAPSCPMTSGGASST